MRIRMTRIVSLLALLMAGAVSANASDDVPKPSKVLFDTPHLTNVAAGTKLVYRLEQKVSNEKLLGLPINDTITVAIEKVADDGKRNVNVQVFTGDRARPPQSIAGLTGNPLLVVFLDRAIRNYSMIAGGKTAYLKNRFKTELAKHAKVEPTKITYKGKEVDGYRVSVVPFERDPNRHKMRGYHGSTYSFLVSSAVPGYFVGMDAILESPKDLAPRLEEHIRFTDMGAAK